MASTLHWFSLRVTEMGRPGLCSSKTLLTCTTAFGTPDPLADIFHIHTTINCFHTHMNFDWRATFPCQKLNVSPIAALYENSSHDNKKFRSRLVEKQGGMAFGFRKTATAVFFIYILYLHCMLHYKVVILHAWCYIYFHSLLFCLELISLIYHSFSSIKLSVNRLKLL